MPNKIEVKVSVVIAVIGIVALIVSIPFDFLFFVGGSLVFISWGFLYIDQVASSAPVKKED